MSSPIDPLSASIYAAKTFFELFGSSGRLIIEKLIDQKIIISKGITIYHKSSEIEYAFMLSLGIQNSRLDAIIKKVSSIINKPLSVPNVIEISGYGMLNQESLMDLGMISLNKNTAIIDFTKIVRDVKSETVFIKIRQNLPEGLRRMLVVHRLNKTVKYIGNDVLENDIEISLDYANLWNKVLDQYTVRDIEFVFELLVDPRSIADKIPKHYAERIIKAAKAISQGNQDAVKFLRIMTEGFVSFEKDNRLKQFRDTVSASPSDLIKITSVTPRMQTLEIAGVGHPVVLPGVLRITIGARLEGKDVTLAGKLIIDLKKFGKILSEIVTEIERNSKNLKV